MKILNLHGYKGSSENCACTTLCEMGFEVLSPELEYDNCLPEEILQTLDKAVTQNNIDLIVGTSLGGFYGAVLSARTKLPAIFINPCLMPFVYLPRLGFQMSTDPFIPLFGELINIDKQNFSVIVGGKDEIIDSHDFTENFFANERFRIVPDGKHSGATLPLKEYFTDVISCYSKEKNDKRCYF